MFGKKWELQYFVDQINSNVVCLIINQSVFAKITVLNITITPTRRIIMCFIVKIRED
jgi:hypothetical protein